MGTKHVWHRGAVLLLLFAAGCTSLTPPRFADARPTFDPLAYFTGHVHSWGVFENRAGEPTRCFTTSSVGRMEGDTLRLDQEFTYADGTHQQRHWLIRHVGLHHYAATANDVVGTAAGEADGNAFRWEYTVALKPGNPLFNVRLRQWMYLEAGGRSMVNRASVNKFGVEIAQVTEYFRRE